jgi:MFS family permease
VGPARDSEFETGGALPTERRPLCEHRDSSGGDSAAAGSSPAANGEQEDESQPLPYRVLFRRTWRLMVAFVALSMFMDIEDRIITPFFYSRVHCCESGQPPLPDVAQFSGRTFNLSVSAVTCRCDIEATYGPSVAVGPDGIISACDVPQIDRSSSLWSHSAHCPNWPYVREQAQLLMTSWSSLIALVSLLFIPSMGQLADLYGRLKVFICSVACLCAALSIFTLDASTQLGSPYYIMATGLLFGAARAHFPAAWAMTFDMVPAASRLKFLPLMSAVTNIAPLLTEALAYPFLTMHLTNYTSMWATLTGISTLMMLFVCCALRETLPREHTKPWAGCRVLLHDLVPAPGVKLWCNRRLCCCCCGGGGGGGGHRPRTRRRRGVGVAEAAPETDSQSHGAPSLGAWTPDAVCEGTLKTTVQLGAAAAVTAGAHTDQQIRILRVILVASLLMAFAKGVEALWNNVLLGALHWHQEELVFLSASSLLCDPSPPPCDVGTTHHH